MNSEFAHIIFILAGVFALTVLIFGLGFFLFKTKTTPAPAVAKKVEDVVPESRFVEVDGVQLHYLQAGEGSDVVLIHGIAASVYIWRFLFPMLQKHYRVTALDLPGFGKSSKFANRDYGLDAQTEIVHKALCKLGVVEASLVGSSMGGAITLWLAKLFPEQYKQVIALSPATDGRLVPAVVPYIRRVAPYFKIFLNKQTMRPLLRRIVSKKQLIDDDAINAYLEPFRDGLEGSKAFWGALSLLADKRLPQDLNTLTCKTVIVYGEKDLLVPRRSIDELVKTIPKAKLILHETGGHHIMEDEPQWTYDVISNSLQTEK